MRTPGAELLLLGPLEVVIDGNRVSIPGRKRNAILSTLLLARGTAVPVGRLVDATWPCEPPATAVKQVRNAVSDLRSFLSPHVDVLHDWMADGYRLDVKHSVVDVMAFDRRAATGRRLARGGHLAEAAAELRSALSLWRGPALAGLASPALEPDIVELDEARLSVLEECIALEFEIGDHKVIGSLVVEMSRLVAEYPIRERFAVLLMRALCLAGNRGRALLVYEKAQGTLARELGVPPGQELRDLHAEIVAGV